MTSCSAQRKILYSEKSRTFMQYFAYETKFKSTWLRQRSSQLNSFLDKRAQQKLSDSWPAAKPPSTLQIWHLLQLRNSEIRWQSPCDWQCLQAGAQGSWESELTLQQLPWQCLWENWYIIAMPLPCQWLHHTMIYPCAAPVSITCTACIQYCWFLSVCVQLYKFKCICGYILWMFEFFSQF